MRVQVSRGGSYAPCMNYFAVVNKRIEDKIIEHLKDLGVIVCTDDEEDWRSGVLLSDEDLEGIVPEHHLRDLNEGYTIRFNLDDHTALTLYGHDCNTIGG